MRWRRDATEEVPPSERTRCSTRYPIFLVHGTGFRDDNPLYRYWGRIPESLAARGADVYQGGQDSWGTIEDNAAILAESLMACIERSQAEKVNIVAHSKGGLEARYLISRLGMGRYVASLTTISTPHRGSRTLDLFHDSPAALYRTVALFVNVWNRIAGDRKPDFYRASRQMSTRECAAFNAAVADDPAVLYQSYAARMKHPFGDPMYFFSYLVVKLVEGDNDGLVAVSSARWGDYRGVIESGGWRGVSHSDLVDLWRCNLPGFDVRRVYVELVAGLKERGL